jgi:hypothetical protein
MVLSVSVASIPPTGQSSAGSGEPAPEAGDLASYLTMPGDQVVTVPDGTYAGATVAATHDETDGQYGGWLILQAESQHGVTVAGDLYLGPGTSRVLFVGFRFDSAEVVVRGEHIAFWYSDHIYPDRDWYAAGRRIPRQVTLQHPGRVISLLGASVHDFYASPITISGVENVDVRGVHVFDLYEPEGSDPEDLSHLNAISLLGGATTDLVVSHSYFRGARVNHQTDFGNVSRLRYEHIWFTAGWGAAFHFHATNGNRISESARVDVRSWGHVGDLPLDRIDKVDGVVVPAGSRPDRVEVVDHGVIESPPPEGSEDPATLWRTWHPYDSWREYFGWTGAAE